MKECGFIQRKVLESLYTRKVPGACSPAGRAVGTVEPVPSRRGELWAFGGSCVEEVVLSSALKDRRVWSGSQEGRCPGPGNLVSCSRPGSGQGVADPPGDSEAGTGGSAGTAGKGLEGAEVRGRGLMGQTTAGQSGESEGSVGVVASSAPCCLDAVGPS